MNKAATQLDNFQAAQLHAPEGHTRKSATCEVKKWQPPKAKQIGMQLLIFKMLQLVCEGYLETQGVKFLHFSAVHNNLLITLN